MEDKWLLVILVIAIVLGASRLPSLGRNLGQGISELRKGIVDATGDHAGGDGPTTGSDVKPADGHDATPPV
jgi:TatA/E family protein of Tat protein translocase